MGFREIGEPPQQRQPRAIVASPSILTSVAAPIPKPSPRTPPLASSGCMTPDQNKASRPRNHRQRRPHLSTGSRHCRLYVTITENAQAPSLGPSPLASNTSPAQGPRVAFPSICGPTPSNATRVKQADGGRWTARPDLVASGRGMGQRAQGAVWTGVGSVCVARILEGRLVLLGGELAGQSGRRLPADHEVRADTQQPRRSRGCC